MAQNSNDIIRTFQRSARAYVFALVLVAALSTSAFFVLRNSIKMHSHSAAVINTSGRQRMLTERLALYSEYFVVADAAGKQKYRTDIQDLLERYTKSHEILTTENETLGAPLDAVRELYFGQSSQLDSDVRIYVRDIRELISTDGAHHELDQEILRRIRTQQDLILPKLDQAVKLNQLEGDDQVATLQSLETVVFASILILLFLEAIFIFRPIFSNIANLLGDAYEAREDAIAANDTKSAFLATVTHEVRGPMISVREISESLLEGEVNGERRLKIQTLHRLTGDLVRWIDDLLDYSKIEAGKLEIDLTDFSFVSLANDTQTLFMPIAQKKKIKLSVDVDPFLPELAKSDPFRLRQVLTNFASNALKFTPVGGRVSISLTRIASESIGGARLRMEVRDTGHGIPAVVQPQLFTRYVQGQSSTAREHGGTGLGLSICKQIADLMNAKIGFNSFEGHGSTFWFEVEIEPVRLTASERDVSTMDDENLPIGMEILLADDNEVNRHLMAAQLRQMGARVQTVNNGADAVAAATTSDFDMIFIDCEMPVLNGFESTKQIRRYQVEHRKRLIPIVAVTGHPYDSVITLCSSVGMDDVLTKPIPRKALREIVRKWVVLPEHRTTG